MEDPSAGESYERQFEAGEVIYQAGDAGTGLFVIQSGEVELSRPCVGETRLFARLSRGEFFGEMSLLVGGSRQERAVALSKARLLELDAATFQRMCIDRPEVTIRVLRRIAERVQELERRLAAVGADDLLRPVVRALLGRLRAGEEGGRVETNLRALAQEAGLSMLEAHLGLQRLLQGRLVRLADDVLHVPDVDALAKCLEAASA